ncbi:uncharacterized protein cd8b [Clupea harengus]|uniref:Uncharacterized protein cd8b n=1 Tax=Clupea harengus TaxID=7950 RepID=A0A6P8GAI5_CLUHA|nr:uncharacterized protein cd8b [Clupea harengus]
MSLTTLWVTLGLWTAALAAVTELYPATKSSVILTCDCETTSCQRIYWYRIRQSDGVYEHILFINGAGIEEVSQTSLHGRLQGRKGGSKSYTLTVSDLRLEDAGWYSCFIPKQTEFPGWRLRVGEIPPTQQPQTTTTTTTTRRRYKPKHGPSCCFSYLPPQGCGKWVLWPLSGGLIVLAVLLVAVLYYFSRLPKKCRHRFVKGKQLG